MPQIYKGLLIIKDSFNTINYKLILKNEFEKFSSESIDYGIMEKTNDIFVISGAFGWDDVGSWLAIERINKTDNFGNVFKGNVLAINTQNTTVVSNDKLIATVGLEHIVIVNTDDALLVCDKNHSGEIKKILENLRICNKAEYL